MDTYYAHIIRELIAQEYIVVAADYRGSTGYGSGTYNNIDYGGLENEDVYISRNYMVDNFDIVDGNRVGIMGWSHGGMITLMNLFNYPGQYKCGFAGVPVSYVYPLSIQGIFFNKKGERVRNSSPVTFLRFRRRPFSGCLS